MSKVAVPVTPNDFSEIRWRGHWIWTEAPAMPSSPFAGMGSSDECAQAHGLFRKRFVVEQVPKRAPTRMTADSRYILYANGQEAFRGPVRSQPRRMHYDLFDLAPYLKAGENVIAVCVKYYGAANSYWMPAVANERTGFRWDALSPHQPDQCMISQVPHPDPTTCPGHRPGESAALRRSPCLD